MLVRRPSGEYTVSREGWVIAEGQTLSCCHCGLVFAVQPGSGNQRGWCFRCAGPTCGGKGCQSCTPFERRLEAMEQRQRLYCEVSRR